jgi:plasmid stabilization system protein ParE
MPTNMVPRAASVEFVFCRRQNRVSYFFARPVPYFFIMARGSKSKYTDKQKRQAEHIEESYEKRGASRKVAAQRAWQTVNKQTGGGEKSGTGRKAAPSAKKAARRESGRRAAASRKLGSRKVQSHPTRRKASASAK